MPLNNFITYHGVLSFQVIQLFPNGTIISTQP
jgi:hypothetical protein